MFRLFKKEDGIKSQITGLENWGEELTPLYRAENTKIRSRRKWLEAQWQILEIWYIGNTKGGKKQVERH